MYAFNYTQFPLEWHCGRAHHTIHSTRTHNSIDRHTTFQSEMHQKYVWTAKDIHSNCTQPSILSWKWSMTVTGRTSSTSDATSYRFLFSSQLKREIWKKKKKNLTELWSLPLIDSPKRFSRRDQEIRKWTRSADIVIWKFPRLFRYTEYKAIPLIIQCYTTEEITPWMGIPSWGSHHWRLAQTADSTCPPSALPS